MSSQEDLVVINYYARRKLYRLLQNHCQEASNKKGADPILSYWKAFGMIMENKLAEGMRELQPLREKRDLLISTSLALIYAHERCQMIDREAIEELQAKLTIDDTTAGERALLQAALFYWHTNETAKAKEYIDRVLETASSSSLALSILGWIDLTGTKENVANKSNLHFEAVLQKNPKDIESIMGMIAYHRRKKNLSAAMEQCNLLIVHSENGFIPALIEHMFTMLESNNWDGAIESATRITAIDAYNIDAISIIALAEICRDGNQKTAAQYLDNLLQAIDRNEPSNKELYFQTAKVFARISGGKSSKLISKAAVILQRALKLDPNNSSFLTEQGYQQLLMNKVSDAAQSYSKAISMDEGNVSALQGLIKCRLLEGFYDEAEQQLELLNEIQKSIGKSAELYHLTSMLTWYKYGDAESRKQLLREAINIQMKLINSVSMSVNFFAKVNPEFLLEIARDLMDHIPSEPRREGEEVNPTLKNVIDLLQVLQNLLPSHVTALYYLARVKFLNGDKSSAQTTLNTILKLDPTYYKAHILMAQIHISNESIKSAMQSLEMGLSYNFEVRNSPIYHLLKARALRQQGQNEEAVTVLNFALNLPLMKSNSKDKKKEETPTRVDEFISQSERASIYLELAHAYTSQRLKSEANKVMQEAIREFSGTSEEIRITIANAELSMHLGDVDTCLALLGSIGQDKPYYIEARTKMAEIYKNQKKDKKAYTKCYRELFEKNPTVETCLLLGDAYMGIQEPEQAVIVYQQALRKSPKDINLSIKIGRALVKAHDYNKAINYYETAIKNDTAQSHQLRYDLAELYRKLKRYTDAERIIKNALSHGETEDLGIISQDVRLLMALAEVHKGAKSATPSPLESLLKAYELQQTVVTKSGLLDNRNQKILAADICFLIAEDYSFAKDYNNALRFYNEALKYYEVHKKSMLALARLHITRGDLEAAQNTCMSMLKLDVANEEAMMIIAENMFKKGEFDAAVFHYQQLLEKKPEHHMALVALIELLRRIGKLNDAEAIIQNAEKACKRADLDTGFHFCKGLYNRYMNNPNEAIKEFNIARKDPEWREKALVHMIEICLNPENDTVGGETLESVNDSAGGSNEKTDSEMMAIKTAERLLKELPQTGNTLRSQVLDCYAMMATKQKQSIEKALQKFTDMVAEEREYVPGLLGLASAYMLLKQTPRARNQLKRIAKMDWSTEYAEDFERSWLLLSDIYIQGGKYDLAQELLKKCLANNKSCAKAWEYMGFIMEREQSYRDASDHYENAWKYEHEASPGVGFKLAFNYLKAKRYVESINVCHKILDMYPEYPKIRKEILEKARAGIRLPG